MDRLATRDDLEAELLDLRDHPLPAYELPVAPARGLRDYANDEVARFGRALDRADGFMVVMGEYNHGYPAVLKNALDHVFPELARKPITFVGYGQVGGARAVEQMRQVAVEFEMAPTRHAVHVLPEILIAARSADPSDIDVFAPLDERLTLAVDHLVWWADALATARAASS
jgi:NAD(P)H-dependent FMN reductase